MSLKVLNLLSWFVLQQLQTATRASLPRETRNRTPQSTGWFEVQVIGGPLLHSKKNGDGFVDSKKLERICNAIRDLL
ncbi:unnamed protein product [Schistosoma intercalatum]|nr:unnamed protein product [Schistosoma intercalatum]